MKKFTTDALQVIAAILITGSSAYAMQPPKVEQLNNSQTPVISQNTAPAEVSEPQPEQVPETVVETAPAASTAVVEPEPVVIAAPAPVVDNETATWNFLIANGFTRNQTAGIMGNLQQEHNFNTSGDGLAQWNGGRRANLYARPNPNDINTQLQFMMDELNGPYLNVQAQIKTRDDLFQATMIFQNLYERCDPNYCMFNQRLQYAQAILARH